MTTAFQAPPKIGVCIHTPPCPSADAPDCEAAAIVYEHNDQGWNLHCNGLVLFDDTGGLKADGTTIEPHRARPDVRYGFPRQSTGSH